MIDDSGKGATIAVVEVSRVIDGEPRVRAAVVEHIRQAVAELGYVPDQAARSRPPAATTPSPSWSPNRRTDSSWTCISSSHSYTYVDADNRGGAWEAVRHLIPLGRRRIGTITGPLNQASVIDRLADYRDVLVDTPPPAHR